MCQQQSGAAQLTAHFCPPESCGWSAPLAHTRDDWAAGPCRALRWAAPKGSATSSEGPSTHAATLEFLTPEELERATYFAEVVYRPLGKVRRIRMSSRPHLPDGFVPRIWPDARLH